MYACREAEENLRHARPTDISLNHRQQYGNSLCAKPRFLHLNWLGLSTQSKAQS